jgi:Rod binding protein
MPINYSDFAGLHELRARASETSSEQSLEAAAKQFEAMFIQMMMKSMRDANATMKSGLFDNAGTDMFEDMLDKEFSVQFGQKGAFGLAEMLVAQLRETTNRDTSTETESANRQLQPPAPSMALPNTADQLRLHVMKGALNDE